ncbi:MAG TPA: protein kinase [Terriglobales bacterium]|nr:protein kinase [Terriglobales bacterium]
MVGRTISHYRIVEQVGAGGMGVVYRAHDERLDRDVALKVLPSGALSDDAARKRFRTEALTLSRLNHPNVATVYDFDTADKLDFLVMELVAGASLALRPGPLPNSDLIEIGKQIAKALEEAHAQGIVHRDLKPGNVMITPKGQVKLLDFGLAGFFGPAESDETRTMAWPPQGTAPYMAPEQVLAGRVDARSDIYAMGALLYELATGQRPFQEKVTAELIAAILRRSPTPPSELNHNLGPGLQQVILRCLEKDPKRRYQSASEVLAALESLAANRPVAWGRRRLPAVALAVVLAVGATLAGPRLRRFVWSRPALAAPVSRVLVADFDNRTSNPVFDQTLSELLSSALEQSKRISVFPPNRLPDALRLMKRTENSRIDEQLGREICEREALQALVAGSISRFGDHYLLLVRALTPHGDTLAQTRAEVADVADIPGAVDSIAKDLRTDFGESGSSIAKNFLPLAQVTSPSLEAVRSFSLGKQRLYSAHPQEAAVFFQKALELDSKFAMADEYLAITYEQLGDNLRAKEFYTAASRLADRVTEPERRKILGDYYLFLQDYDRALAEYQVLAQLQPDDPAVHLNLAQSYAGKFRFDEGLKEAQQAARLRPEAGPKYVLSTLYFLQGDTERALATAQDILRENPDYANAIASAAACFLAKGQWNDAERMYKRLVSYKEHSESQGRAGLADLAAARGQFGEARRQLETGIQVDTTLGNRYAAAQKKLMLASLYQEAGDAAGFAGTMNEIGIEHQDSSLTFLAGQLYARGRMFKQAELGLRVLQQAGDGNISPESKSLATLLRAEILLAHGRAAAAVQAAELATSFYDAPESIEVLARAYRRAGRYDDTARELERLLARSHERMYLSYDAPAFHKVIEAHYWLGRTYQQLGRVEAARAQFREFVNSWSQADRGLPLYQDAQRRLRTASRAMAGTPTPVM